MARLAKPKQPVNQTCKQVAALLLAYINDELSPPRKRALQRHLKICPDCVNFLKTYRKTIQATGTIYPEEMPPTVRNNIWHPGDGVISCNFLLKRSSNTYRSDN